MARLSWTWWLVDQHGYHDVDWPRPQTTFVVIQYRQKQLHAAVRVRENIYQSRWMWWTEKRHWCCFVRCTDRSRTAWRRHPVRHQYATVQCTANHSIQLEHHHPCTPQYCHNELFGLTFLTFSHVNNRTILHKIVTTGRYKKLSYCWETVRRESMPRIAEMNVKMTT